MNALAYVDEAVSAGLTARKAALAPTAADRASAKKAATKVIAGFDVFDEDAERNALDAMVAERGAEIERFQKDRADVRKTLADKGIDTLAVVPTTAWKAICRAAGLFIMHPTRASVVYYAEDAFDRVKGLEGVSKRLQEAALDGWAEDHWPEMLGLLFPNGESLPAPESQNGFAWEARRAASYATLVLPTPPKDVQAILVKASSSTLHVAAEPNAIAFTQTMRQLRDHQRAEAERIQRERDADPIVYIEHGTASAVIAQFGDFPIERAVVDAVVASDDLIPDGAKAKVSAAAYDASLNDLYQQAMLQQMQQATTSIRRSSLSNLWIGR